MNTAHRREFLPTRSGRGGRAAALSILAVIATCAGRPAVAVEAECEELLEEEAEVDGGLREKASRFTPVVKLTAWVRRDSGGKRRDRIATSALSPPPDERVDRHEQDRPFRWAIQLQWDVLDILEPQRPRQPVTTAVHEAMGCHLFDGGQDLPIEETGASTPPDDVSWPSDNEQHEESTPTQTPGGER